MNYKYDVSIIIVNYNGKRYLKNLFDSLVRMKCEQISYEVVFVDNASSDDSIEFLNELEYNKKLNLKIVANKENQGFAQGNNTGVTYAEGKYVVFLNNDTAVTESWLIQLYNCMTSNENYGMVASKLLFFYDFLKVTFKTMDNILMSKKIFINGEEYNIDNKFCKNLLYDNMITCFGHTEIALPLLQGVEDYVFQFSFTKYNPETDYIVIGGECVNISESQLSVHVKRDVVDSKKIAIIQNAGSGVNEHFEGYDIGMGEADAPQYNIQKEISAGCGAAIIMLKEDFERVKGFDARFFMYYEDVDLSFKVRSLGKKIIYCPEAVVRHIHTGSSKEWSPFFAYHVHRNKLLFIYKNITRIQYVKYFIRQLVSAVVRKDTVKKQATIDSFKMIFFHKQCTYR